MSIFSDNITITERYISHLAGMEGGKNPLDWNISWAAASAQKHPICNSFCSTINGVIGGISTTILGLLAYPLVNSSTGKSIIGDSKWDICTACASSASTISSLALKINGLADDLGLSWVRRQFFPLEQSLASLTQCTFDFTNDQQTVNTCRGANYVASVYDTMIANPRLICSIAIGLTAWTALSNLNRCEREEIEAENALIDKLERRYASIASRLESLPSNPQTREMAQKILDNKRTIKAEIDDLQLPNLRLSDIHAMTRRVFRAARELARG